MNTQRIKITDFKDLSGAALKAFEEKEKKASQKTLIHRLLGDFACAAYVRVGPDKKGDMAQLLLENKSFMGKIHDFRNDIPFTAQLDLFIEHCVHPEDRGYVFRRTRREIILKETGVGEEYRVPFRTYVDGCYGDYELRFSAVAEGSDVFGFVVGLKNMDKERQAENMSAEAARATEIIGSVLRRYKAVYIVNLHDGTYKALRRDHDIHRRYGRYEDFSRVMSAYVDGDVYEGDQMVMRRELTTASIRRKLHSASSYSIEYRAYVSEVPRWHEISISSLGNNGEYLFGLSDRDTEILTARINDTLQGNYFAIYVANLMTDQLKIIKKSDIIVSSGLAAVVPYMETVNKMVDKLSGGAKKFYKRLQNVEQFQRDLGESGTLEAVYKSPRPFDGSDWVKVTCFTMERSNGRPVIMLFCYSKAENPEI